MEIHLGGNSIRKESVAELLKIADKHNTRLDFKNERFAVGVECSPREQISIEMPSLNGDGMLEDDFVDEHEKEMAAQK